jgi:hypothetical protein
MSLKLKNTEKYLEDYTIRLKDKLVVETSRTDRTRSYSSQSITSPITASGSLQESYKYHKSRKTGIASFNIIGNAYGETVDEGTRSSKPPVSRLINWLISKNRRLIDLAGNTVNLNDIKKVRRIAFAIQKSLNIKGIQKTGFITDLVNQEFNQLQEINIPITKDIITDIDNILKRAGYEKTGKETYTIETKTIR